jgi:hypothetical protein
MALQRFRTMVVAITWIIASAALAEPPTALGEDLVPAGSINAALSAKPITIVIDDIPDVRQHATAIRDRFFPGAPLITGAAARDTDLGGHTLIVYGTPGGNPWLQTHAGDLPFAFGEGTVRLNGTDYDGAHLRVICAVRNPQNPERRAILYVASDPADLVEINAVFHGPTGWVVADGRRILASGDFTDTALGPRRMEADLDELAATVDAVHPAAIDGAPSAVRDAIEEARTRIRSGIDRATFEASLNHVILALHDSHSTLAAPHATRHIDLPIAWLDEGPIVTHDTSHLRRGDRVVSIGGLPPEEILERLRGLIPTENDWWLRHVAEQSIRSDGVLRALGAGTIPVDVRVGRSGSEITRGLPAAERRQPRIDRLPWARFTIEPENGLGIFTLDRCVNDDRYRDALAAFFNAVADAGIDRIVVDLRRNGGGNSSVANEFLRYVNVADYADFSALVRVSEAAMDQRQLPGPPRVIQNDLRPDLASHLQQRVMVRDGPARQRPGNARRGADRRRARPLRRRALVHAPRERSLVHAQLQVLREARPLAQPGDVADARRPRADDACGAHGGHRPGARARARPGPVAGLVFSACPGDDCRIAPRGAASPVRSPRSTGRERTRRSRAAQPHPTRKRSSRGPRPRWPHRTPRLGRAPRGAPPECRRPRARA